MNRPEFHYFFFAYLFYPLLSDTACVFHIFFFAIRYPNPNRAAALDACRLGLTSIQVRLQWDAAAICISGQYIARTTDDRRRPRRPHEAEGTNLDLHAVLSRHGPWVLALSQFGTNPIFIRV